MCTRHLPASKPVRAAPGTTYQPTRALQKPCGNGHSMHRPAGSTRGLNLRRPLRPNWVTLRIALLPGIACLRPARADSPPATDRDTTGHTHWWVATPGHRAVDPVGVAVVSTRKQPEEAGGAELAAAAACEEVNLVIGIKRCWPRPPRGVSPDRFIPGALPTLPYPGRGAKAATQTQGEEGGRTLSPPSPGLNRIGLNRWLGVCTPLAGCVH